MRVTHICSNRDRGRSLLISLFLKSSHTDRTHQHKGGHLSSRGKPWNKSELMNPHPLSAAKSFLGVR